MEQKATVDGLCRDCFARAPATGRCPACRSPRVLTHDELDALTIAHLDCDAFYAAIEKRDNPELRDKPLIVGGGRRGVVSTACYIARTYGIRSAMPMFKALKACPRAVVVRPDMAKYVAVSRQVRALMDAITPAVEPLSIDEAFLDLGGTQRLHGMSAAETLARLARRIEDTLDITVSIGLSYNKFLAKVASDLDKPRGFAVIGRAEALAFLKDQPVTLIWGVGTALDRKLARDGIRTIGQLQTMDEASLMRRYGVMGRRLYRLSRGQDSRDVGDGPGRRSVSSERTLAHDVADYDALERLLWPQCERVSAALKRRGLAGWTVTLKLKTARHRIRTRSHRLDQPSQLADVLFEVGRSLLAPEADGERYRLIGIGVADLCDATLADQPDLIEPARTRRARAERAMDTLRDRYGRDSIVKGRSLPDG